MPIFDRRMSIEDIYENLKQPEPVEEELYDVPDPDEISGTAPPAVIRGNKPKLGHQQKQRLPIKPPISNKPSQVNNLNKNIKHQDAAQSITERKAMFAQNLGGGKVPSPFRNSLPLGNQMITQFRRNPPSTFSMNNNDHNSMLRRKDSNNNGSQHGYNAEPTPDSYYEVNGNPENYEVPEQNDEMYVDPLEDNDGRGRNDLPPRPDMSQRGLPAVPNKPKKPIPTHEFLNRINTIKQKERSPVAEETYEVCDTPENYEVCDTDIVRSRNNSNSSQRSTKSNSSWSGSLGSPTNLSSRENSFRNNLNQVLTPPSLHSSPHNSFRSDHHPRSPMESRPLPNPNEDEQEAYEVVESQPGSRPPAPIPTHHIHNNQTPIRNRSIPPTKPSQEMEDYVYAEEDMPLFPPPRKLDPNIKVPDEDEYEMPPENNPTVASRKGRSESLQYIDPVSNHQDTPPMIPERFEDPKRISPPSRPPKIVMKLPSQPAIDDARMKPRHSYDGNMNPNTRERLELNILTHGWLAGLHCQQKKDNENVEHMRNKLKHNLQLPCATPLTQEKGRSGSDNAKPAMSSKRSIPIPSKPEELSRPFNAGVPCLPINIINNSLKRQQISQQPKPPVPPPSKPNVTQRHSLPQHSHSPSLRVCSWYQGKIDRIHSEQTLKSKRMEGGFIIRDTTKGEGYSISVYHNGNVTHLRVPLKDGRYYLGTSNQDFATVQDLVSYYQKNKVALISGGEVLLKT
ncbi:rho GTPase-activating protein gacJ-like isoform X2 [Hydractinia symbiolongicarpus]|uniref:rho GTPase-activating protein gacJ-like isoform X2 n=1 Tax=Hydractinia symbiolongicarpus TaxID=13093 RepID=UPI00254E96E7|nr:rho GTPase-activating protein gacJ-like isoform X2 [Hydractinia symbiolongicarpus]